MRLKLKFLKEPLLHFVLLGAMLFLLFFYVNDDPFPEDEKNIVVNNSTLSLLIETFERTWMRPPTSVEMKGLIDNYVKEEIYYREGLALGLDKNDLVIRRRIHQKLEFLNTDLVETFPPKEAELKAYLANNPEKYRKEETITFHQIYINVSKNGNDPWEKARKLLTQMRNRTLSEQELKQYGDSSMLPEFIKDESLSGIVRLFGEEFADEIIRAPLGVWSGPYTSTYGLHLVYLSEKKPAQTLSLEEVSDAVERDFNNDRRRDLNNKLYQALRKRYSVTTEDSVKSSTGIL